MVQVATTILCDSDSDGVGYGYVVNLEGVLMEGVIMDYILSCAG